MTMAWSWVRVSCLVLLFSGCLAAVVNKETPEALVGSPDITPTSLALTSFSWNTEAPAVRVPGTYKSLEVCFKKAQADASAGDIYTLLIDNGGEVLTEYDSGVVGTDNKCATFTNEAVAGIPSPPDNVAITYELHIANAAGTEQQMGFTTFTVDPAQYENTPPDVVCGGIPYTRIPEIADPETDCPGGVMAGETTCYTPAAEGEVGPDDEGCITNAGVSVCLSDKPGTDGPPSDGTIDVNSLTYPVAPAIVATLNIAYGKGDTAATTVDSVEFLMQDSSDPTLLYAGACVDATGVSCPTTADYTQQVKTYQVCAVGVDADDAVVSYTPEYEITDLNLAVFDNGEHLEFGFKNANPGDDANPEGKIYYASVVTDDGKATDVDAVAIDCTGVDPEHTCYGFLTVPGADDYNVKVGYGTKTGGTIDSDFGSNIIIAPHTKA